MLSDKQKQNLRCKRKGTTLVGCRVGKNDDFKKIKKKSHFFVQGDNTSAPARFLGHSLRETLLTAA